MALLTRAAQEYLNNLCHGEFITYTVTDSDVTQQLLLERSARLPILKKYLLNTMHKYFIICFER